MKTKGFRLLTVILTVVMLVALSLNVMAAKGSAVTKDGLTAQLFTDKDSYKTGESVKVGVQVDNHTGREVFLFAEFKLSEEFKLTGESLAFDTFLKAGESWTTPNDVWLEPVSEWSSAAGSTAATGDTMQTGFWGVLIVLAVCGIIALLLYGKNGTTWLCIMLCVTMVGGMVVAAVPAHAADMNGDITLSCIIQLDGKEAEVKATVSYVIYEEAEEKSASPTPSEAPTETPSEIPSETMEETEEPESSTTPVPDATPTPEWIVLFETDVENGMVGEKPATGSGVNEWTQIVENTSKLLYTRVEEEGNGKALHIYCGEGGTKGGPRASRNIQIKGMEKLTIEFKTKTDGANSYIAYYTDSAINLWSGKSEDAWTQVKLELDILNQNYITYINGINSGETSNLNFNEDVKTLEFRFSAGTVQPGTGIYVDDIKISGYGIPTPDESILGDDNTVNWENVLPKNDLSENSLVNNLVSHPRILVSEWEEIYQKISNSDDETITIWYNGLKADADSYLNTEPPGYANSNGRNQLIEARAGRERIMSLAFVYNIEKLSGNSNAHLYMEKAYSDMVAMGEWQDWSAFSAYLVTGELMFGYACAYDWLYNDLTETQKVTIYDIVQEQALTGLVYNYEGVKTSTNFTTNSINWNPVCNAGAIATAFAFADEQPLIAEYILEKAPEYITNCLKPYAPQGGYPEGAMYWGLGTNFLTIAMHLLDNGFIEEYNIYNKYPSWEYAKAEGIAETGEYHIYYNGTDGRFNYGDASSQTVSYAAIYYLSDRFNKPEYAWYENKLQKDIDDYLQGYEAIAAICFYDPNKAVKDPGDFALDKFYYSEQDVNGIVMRSDWEDKEALYAAMQGGNNSENHMHLSLGTYVIDFKGTRFVEDIYASNYSLSGAKNTIYYKRAEAYNTLVINPSNEGEQYMDGIATVTRYGTSDNTAFGIMDMSKAYNAGDATVLHAERGMMLTENRRRVIIQDEVQLDKNSEVYWFANAATDVRIASDGKSAILEQDGERMLARIIQGPEEAMFSTMGRTSLVSGVNNTVNSGIKLVIHLQNISEFALAVEYIGLGVGEGIPETWNYVPMAQWTAESVSSPETEPDMKVYAGDEELTFFNPERQKYALDFSKNITIPSTIKVEEGEANINATIIQASCIGTYGITAADNNQDGIPDDTAAITIISEGNINTYYIKMQYDPFEEALSNTDEGVLNSIKAELEGRQLPEVENFIKVVDVEASEWGSYPKFGIIDGIINEEIANRWASNTTGCWIQLDFGENKALHSMAFSGVTQNSRAYDFDVQVSEDGENWSTIHTDGAQITEDWMYIIDFDETKYSEVLSNVRYVKMLGKGYNDGSGKWNTWAEVRFYESHEKEQTDKNYWNAYFTTAFEGEVDAEKQIMVTGYDYNKNVVDMSDAIVTYEVVDASIVNVSTEGKLSFLKEGATTVKIKAVKGGFTASTECDVVCTSKSVTPPQKVTEVIFTTDFSDTPVNADNIPLKTTEIDSSGNAGQWDRVVYNISKNCFVKVEDEQLHLYCGTSPKSKYPRVDKLLNLDIYTSLVVEFKVKMDGKNCQIQSRYGSEGVKLLSLAPGLYSDWANVKIEMNCTDTGWISTAYVNEEISDVYQNVVMCAATEEAVYLSFETVSLAANTGVYYDDITITGTKYE